MSNSTVVVVSANAPSPVPPPPSPPHSLPLAPSPNPLPSSKSQSFYISWFGIVGIVAAFLVLAAIALGCFWYKRNAYKKALQEQRNYYIQYAVSHTREEDSSDDEEQSRDKREQTDWALPPDCAPKREVDG
jgi:hypothetical protein